MNVPNVITYLKQTPIFEWCVGVEGRMDTD